MYVLSVIAELISLSRAYQIIFVHLSKCRSIVKPAGYVRTYVCIHLWRVRGDRLSQCRFLPSHLTPGIISRSSEQPGGADELFSVNFTCQNVLQIVDFRTDDGPGHRLTLNQCLNCLYLYQTFIFIFIFFYCYSC